MNLISSLLIAGTLLAGKPSPTPPPRAGVVIASWNIEGFDAPGPEDLTFPTRGLRHLAGMAEIIRETGADVIGLEEVTGTRSLGDLVSALNQGGWGNWTGAAGRTSPRQSHVALLWRTDTLEIIGEVAELSDLPYGYRAGQSVTSPDQRLFPRIPLAARFRARAAPGSDFTVVALHLKAGKTGIFGGLDSEDRRRRGEWETLIRRWVDRPEAQGALRSDRLVILGDMNEAAPVIVQLLDQHGTTEEVKGRLILDPSDFSDPRASLLFASAAREFPRDFTFQGNTEKGENGAAADSLWDYKNFIDHILISRSLLDAWDGEFAIEYFELDHPLSDHVHFSDHRPVGIRLRFPAEANGESPGLSPVSCPR
jgi:endonuclease/exonuclease/phosphatase family metal-dependent hydrolase